MKKADIPDKEIDANTTRSILFPSMLFRVLTRFCNQTRKEEGMGLKEEIKAIRVGLGETMEQFGQRFNTSKGTVNNWEKGRNAPNKANLKKIAALSDNPRDFIAVYLNY